MVVVVMAVPAAMAEGATAVTEELMEEVVSAARMRAGRRARGDAALLSRRSHARGDASLLSRRRSHAFIQVLSPQSAPYRALVAGTKLTP